MTGCVESVPMGGAIEFLVDKSREFPNRIEYMGYATGDNDKYLNRFNFPRVIGINSPQRDLLDDLVRVSGSTQVFLAISLECLTGETLGIRIRYTEPGRQKEHDEFFSSRVLVTPSGDGVFAYLPSSARANLLSRIGSIQIDNCELRTLICQTGVQITIADQTYVYLPIALEVGQIGTEHSYYVSATVLKELIDPKNGFNRFDSGLSFGDIHIHHSEDRRTAPPEELEMIEALGADYFIYPSSYDVLAFADSEITMRKAGLSTQSVMKGIVALTPHKDPTKRDLFGTAFLDVRTLTNDRKAEARLLETAKAAQDATGSNKIEAYRLYFDVIRNLVTEDMPDFVDLRVLKKGYGRG